MKVVVQWLTKDLTFQHEGEKFKFSHLQPKLFS
jgi:hypothetical protein